MALELERIGKDVFDGEGSKQSGILCLSDGLRHWREKLLHFCAKQ